MAQGTTPSSALEIELTKLSPPQIFLVRMVVFIVLCTLVLVILYKQIILAFFANPGLNALIAAVLAIGIIFAFRQVIRLYPEIAWVNNFRIASPGRATADRKPRLLAPMAAILGGERTGRVSISQQTMRHLLDSIATRLDEARDISRYMTGLLVFLGLLGTFWGLIETVGSVGKVIDGLKVGGDAGSLFDTLKEGLAAPLGGMGISFSSSLFGLAGSLILGFLDLQSSQAQNRFYTDLEDWLATTVREYGGETRADPSAEIKTAIEGLRASLEARPGQDTTAAMASLAEAIQGLVTHMRAEQQMIREWADGQGEQNREIKKLLELLAQQPGEELTVSLPPAAASRSTSPAAGGEA
ncbi:flagellar motor protein MotA [Nitrobacter sp. JJSN]|uniref:flagellar motor protein MotA n=1 Tax=Nitrobacter sp. JJSN TaxID=3453033 RepID=UPI003F768929